jgi:hypothetical protein
MDFCLLQAAWANCTWIFVCCKLHGPIVHGFLSAASCMGQLYMDFCLLQAVWGDFPGDFGCSKFYEH